jgi:hypothetical protein
MLRNIELFVFDSRNTPEIPSIDLQKKGLNENSSRADIKF